MQSSLAFSLSNNIRFNPLLACRQFVDSSSSSTFLKSDFPSIKLHTATQLKLRFSASPSPVSSRSTVVSHCGISSNNSSASETGGIRAWVEAVTEAISTAFPIWVSLGCLLGLLRPASFGWVTPKWTMFGLTLTMLGMGMTLTLDDLSNAFAMPKQLFAGFMLQYSISCVSNLIFRVIVFEFNVYRDCQDVCLLFVLFKTTLTCSFHLQVMTPFLTAKLAGQYVAVDATGLLTSTMQVVLLPVLAGAFLNQYFQSLVKFVSPLMPPIAVGTVAVLCGNAIAQSSSAILMSGKQVVLAACLLHTSGFFFGYVLSRILGVDTASSRTISIEVGMQNSVLGVVLATQHFGNPLTAVPCAVSSVCHSILGSVLAGIWRRSVPPENQD
ncbi:Probable sodium/metabolite cotransporter BASS1, chloroplastic [Linum perenne]